MADQDKVAVEDTLPQNTPGNPRMGVAQAEGKDTQVAAGVVGNPRTEVVAQMGTQAMVAVVVVDSGVNSLEENKD